MLKKQITFEDLETGQPRTEEWYFNLNKQELIELEVTSEGGYEAAMMRIVESADGKAIMAEFKRFILASVGEKTDAGGFRKNDEIRQRFQESPAFSELFMELVTDSEAGARFLAGIVPQQLGQKFQEVQNQRRREAAQAAHPAQYGRSAREEAEFRAAQRQADPAQGREEYLASLIPAEPEPVQVEPIIERNVFDQRQQLEDGIVEDPQEQFRRSLRREAREQMGVDISPEDEAGMSR